MNTKELLNRAADLMQTHGHAKFRFVVTDQYETDKGYGQIGSMCLQGALQAATGEQPGFMFVSRQQPVYDRAMISLAETILSMKGLDNSEGRVKLTRYGNTPCAIVPTWNNHYATEEQAIAALRAAAEKVDA